MSSRISLLALSLVVFVAPVMRAQPPGGRGGAGGAAAPAGGAAAAAAAAFAAMPDDAIVANTLRLPDADIDTVLGALQLYTGKSLLRPATLPVPQAGGFNIDLTGLQGGISKADAIRAIETVLELNGIAVVPLDDKFLKIVQVANARQESPPIITGSTLDLPASGRVSTKIFQLSFLTAQPFANSITQLMTGTIGGQANIAVLATANAVMITDTVTNLQRIERVLETSDKPVTANIATKAFLLKNARASTTLAAIRQALTPAQLAQVGGQISPDDRANQIIVVGDPRIFPFYEDLINKYDVKADPNTKQEVITLKSAIATEMITILNTIVSGQTQAAQRANAATIRPGVGAAGQAVIGTGAVGATLPGAVPVAAPAAAVAPVAAAPAAAPAVAAAGAAGGAGVTGGNAQEFSSLMTIVADPRTNSIVVNGTADDITLMRNLINKLDKILPQVAIEVHIVEVSLTKNDSTGLSALGLTVGTDTATGTVVPGATAGTTATVGTTNGNRGTHITNVSTLGVGGWNVTGGIVNPLAFNAVMGDVGSRNNVRVIQATTLTTSHNKAASFAVTQQQPIVTGTTAATATTAASSTVSYQNIGITLNVTPQIGDDNTVQMTLDQIVDSVVGTTTIDANTQPIIGHRQATSFVNVKSGDMIVLGGLRTDTRSNSRTKLGFVYEIPVLSNLLGARTRSSDSTELLFFVRPNVIKSGEESAMTTKKINEMSNKDDVEQYLKDPSKPAKDSLLELVK
jgi:general secretion pathway protein D